MGTRFYSSSLLLVWDFLMVQRFLNYDAIESFPVSFVSEERYLGDFFLTQAENNQCLHISLAHWLTFILLFSIHRTQCLLCMFLRMTE